MYDTIPDYQHRGGQHCSRCMGKHREICFLGYVPLRCAVANICGWKDKELNDKMAIYQKSVYASTRMFAQRYRTRDFDPAQRSVRMAEMFYDKILRLS